MNINKNILREGRFITNPIRGFLRSYKILFNKLRQYERVQRDIPINEIQRLRDIIYQIKIRLQSLYSFLQRFTGAESDHLANVLIGKLVSDISFFEANEGVVRAGENNYDIVNDDIENGQEDIIDITMDAPRQQRPPNEQLQIIETVNPIDERQSQITRELLRLITNNKFYNRGQHIAFFHVNPSDNINNTEVDQTLNEFKKLVNLIKDNNGEIEIPIIEANLNLFNGNREWKLRRQRLYKLIIQYLMMNNKIFTYEMPFNPDQAMTFEEFNQHQEHLANIRKIFILRLLFILPFISINTGGSQYQIIVKYYDQHLRVQTRAYYLHKESTMYLLRGLMRILNNFNNLEESDSEYTPLSNLAASDPIRILTNPVLNIKSLTFAPMQPIQQSWFEGEYAQSNTIERMFIPVTEQPNIIRYITFPDTNRRVPYNFFGFIELVNQDDGFVETMTRRFERAIGDLKNFWNTPIDQRRSRGRDTHNGGFFGYFVNLDLDLKRYQLVQDQNDLELNGEMFNMNCLVHALKQTGHFSEGDIYQMSLRCHTRTVPLRKFAEICEAFNFNMKCHKLTTKNKSNNFNLYHIGPSNADFTVDIGLIDHHIFLNEKVPLTKYYLEHRHEIDNIFFKHPIYSKMDKSRRYQIRYMEKKNDKILLKFGVPKYYLTISNALRLLLNERNNKEIIDTILQPMTLTNVISLDMIIYKEFKNKKYKGMLDYNDKLCLKPIKGMVKVNNKTDVVFFVDFETFTVNNTGKVLDQHIPFMCCIGIDETENILTFKGKECGRSMLEYLTNLITTQYDVKRQQFYVYIHNLGYDINFLAKYGITSSMKKGRRMMQATIIYNGINLIFKDSYSLIPSKLEAFGRMFQIGVEKELFPYNYYTEERALDNGIARIDDLFEFMKNEWKEDEQKHFLLNVEKSGSLIDITKFDMMKYCQYYCEKDVEVLKKGLTIFREGIKKEFGLDCINYVSISSIANAIFEKQVYFRTPKLFKVSGIVREFLSYAIHGGRVMCNNNKKLYYKSPNPETEGLCDFDARSLYPSAIRRLWLITGKPQVIGPMDLNKEFLLSCPYATAYVVEITIIKIGKPRQFPLVIGKNKRTGSVLNTNDVPIKMVVCDIELQDLINFQDIDFIVHRGYYWSDQKTYDVQDIIQTIYNTRAQYKEDKNPLETIYKLIMNSVYGKTILKPIQNSTVYVQKDSDEYENLIYNHSAYIEYYNQIHDSDIIAIKLTKPINDHFNFSLFGIHILAMSKRIMNEVMCLAEDLGIFIYYQDTDSMHILNTDLDKLCNAYKDIYCKELIGEAMGQFHSDFELFRDSTNVRSIESYFIGKKCYIDHLRDDQGRTGYHIRMKGIPDTAIRDAANRLFSGDLMELYKALYNGDEIEFNLLAGGKVCFDESKELTIKTRESFNRKVKFIDDPLYQFDVPTDDYLIELILNNIPYLFFN